MKSESTIMRKEWNKKTKKTTTKAAAKTYTKKRRTDVIKLMMMVRCRWRLHWKRNTVTAESIRHAHFCRLNVDSYVPHREYEIIFGFFFEVNAFNCVALVFFASVRSFQCYTKTKSSQERRSIPNEPREPSNTHTQTRARTLGYICTRFGERQIFNWL